MMIEMRPIGIIHSPYKTASETPRQGANLKEPSQIEIYPEFEQGLKDIDGFSHIIVLYMFDRSTGFKLCVVTPWDDIPHGVFASRSQNRPNPIGLSVVRLLSRDGAILNVSGLDALEGSPVLDIKPYVLRIDEPSEVRLGWLENSSKFKKKDRD